MPAPVICAVDEDAGALRRVERELADRYERGYRGSGPDLLGRVRDLHAHAQRGLPIDWGSWDDGSTAEEIFQAMARRQIEYYVVRPAQSPDELFHQSVSTFSRCAVPHAFPLAASPAGRALRVGDPV